MWNIRNSAEDHRGRKGKLNGKSSEWKQTGLLEGRRVGRWCIG